MKIDGYDMQDCGRTEDGERVLKCVAWRGYGPASAHVVTPHSNPALQVFWIFVTVCKKTGKYLLGVPIGAWVYFTLGQERLEPILNMIVGAIS